MLARLLNSVVLPLLRATGFGVLVESFKTMAAQGGAEAHETFVRSAWQAVGLGLAASVVVTAVMPLRPFLFWLPVMLACSTWILLVVFQAKLLGRKHLAAVTAVLAVFMGGFAVSLRIFLTVLQLEGNHRLTVLCAGGGTFAFLVCAYVFARPTLSTTASTPLQ